MNIVAFFYDRINVIWEVTMVQEKNNVFILENLYNVRHLGDIKTLNGL